MSELEEGENAGVAGGVDESHSADAEVEVGLAKIKEEIDYDSIDDENFLDTTTIIQQEQVTTTEESDLNLNGNGTEMLESVECVVKTVAEDRNGTELEMDQSLESVESLECVVRAVTESRNGTEMEMDQSLESVESLEFVVRAVTNDLLDSVDSLESSLNQLDSLETSNSKDKVNRNQTDESSDQDSIFEEMDESRLELEAEQNGTRSFSELIIDESGTEEQDSLLNQNGETEEPVGQEGEGDDGGNSAGTSLETEIPIENVGPVSRSDQADTEVVGEGETAGAGCSIVIKENSPPPPESKSSADAEPDFIDSLIGDVDETLWDHNQALAEDGLGWFNNVPEGEIVEEEEAVEYKPDLTSMPSSQEYQDSISINNVVSLTATTSSVAESFSRSSSRLAINDESNDVTHEEAAPLISHGVDQKSEAGDPSDPTPEGLFFCSVCCSGFPNEELYAEHTLIHTDPSYQAKGAETTSNNLLGRKAQAGVSRSKLQCKICGKNFLKIRSLQNHERSHKHNPQITDNSQDNGMRCKTCHKRFYKLDLLEIHEQYNLCDDTEKQQREISHRVRQLRGENGHPAGNSSKPNQDVGANSRRILMARRRKEPEPSTSQAVNVWDGKDTTDQFSCRICSQVFRGVDSLRQHWIAEHLRVEDMTAQTTNKKLRQGQRKLEPRTIQTDQSVSKGIAPPSRNSKSHPTPTTEIYNYMCVVCHFKVATIEELTAHAKTHFKTGEDGVSKKSKKNAREVKATTSRGTGLKRARSLSPEYGLPPPLSPQQAEVKNERRNSKIKPSTSSKGVAVESGTKSPRKSGRPSRISDLSNRQPASTPQNKLRAKQKKVNLLTSRLSGESRHVEDKSKPESASSDKGSYDKQLSTRTTQKLNVARSPKHSIYKPRSARLTKKLKSRPFLSKRLTNDKSKDKSDTPNSKRLPKRISCEFCNRVFVNMRALRSHKLRSHKPHKDETRKTGQEKSRNMRMRSFSKKPDSEHDADATVQSTPTNSDSHMKTREDKKKGDTATTSNRNENNLHCQLCNKSFVSNSALKSHLEKNHKQKSQATPTTNSSTKNSRSHQEGPAELDISRAERRSQRNAETSETKKKSEVMPDQNQRSETTDDLFSPLKTRKGKLHEKKKTPLRVGKSRLSLDFLKKKTAPSSTTAPADEGSPTAVESHTPTLPDKKSRLLGTDKKDRPLKRKGYLKNDMNNEDAEGTNESSVIGTVKVSDAIAIETLLSHKILILQLDKVNHSSSQNTVPKNESGKMKMRGPKSQKRKRELNEDSDDQDSEKKRTRRSVHAENGVSTPETQTPTSKNGRPIRRRGSEATPSHSRDIDQQKVAADSGTRTSKSHALIPESKSESLTTAKAKPRPASAKTQKPAKQGRLRNVVGNDTDKRHVEY